MACSKSGIGRLRGAEPVAGYNDTLLRYGAAGREVAREHGCIFVDVNH